MILGIIWRESGLKKPRIEVLIEVGRSSRGDYKIPKRGSEVIVGNYDFLRDGRKFFLCQSLALLSLFVCCSSLLLPVDIIIGISSTGYTCNVI